MRATKPLVTVTALVALATLTLAACGDAADETEDAAEDAAGAVGDATDEADDSEPADGASDGAAAPETVEVTIGVAPSLTAVPIYIADAEGYFADEGLEVTLETLQSGAQTIPQLLNGQLQFSISDTVATISAVSNDVPLQIISSNIVGAGEGEEDFVGVVSDGSIAEGDLAALEGRTLAVNQLRGLAELLSRATLDEGGVDPDSVEFIEVPPPDMQAAVAEGRVDTAYVLEPFYTSSLQAGLTMVFEPTGVAGGLPTVTFSSSRQYVEENPDVVERFNNAIARATAAAAEDEDLIRETAAGYTGLPPEVIESIRLPIFTSDASDVDGVGELADLMVQYGFIDEAPPLESYVGATVE